MAPFEVRPLSEDDAPAARALLAARAPHGWRAELDPFVLAQTGSNVLVAACDGAIAGIVRWWTDDEGIAWFDLLASDRAGAGRTLVRAVGRSAQDAGLRVVRCAVPEDGPLDAYFGRMGYLPVGRRTADGASEFVLERRLPLLTVREQRRTDAAAIGAVTGDDPWVFEQGARPGWFVASDGDTVVGVVGVRDAAPGVAAITPPVLLPGYEGRSLEAWMIERAALYAETNGYHSATVAATPALRRLQRDLEDRRWFAEGDEFVRRRGDEPLAGS